MTRKWLFNAIAMIVLIMGLFGSAANTANPVAASDNNDVLEKIEPALLTKFNLEGKVDFIVSFVAKADLSPAYGMDWNSRGEYVYNTLKATAAHSQAMAKGILDAAGYGHQSFIAGNELYVENGNFAIATRLAELDEVAYINATQVYQLDPVNIENPLSKVRWSGDLLLYNLKMDVGSVEAILAWGIADTNAVSFWAAFDVRGEGIKVANIDTGVQYDHPGLDQSFACQETPTSPDCWLDPTRVCEDDLPCDDHGHGTHTMGSMVADDDPTLPYIAGMAPDATWIACKGCTAKGGCPDRTLLACADWILAPGDDPANRPNVVNNSWGGGGGDDWYMDQVEAWRAAGIFPAFSAGNEGPECATIGSPGDYQQSFASAMHDVIRNISPGSSRGPSDFGHDPYTKPNISAPGVSVCSTVPTDEWSCGWSGTSMASPHSAGAVALLWSCNPDLIGDFDTTFQALQNSVDTPPAGECGVPEDGEGNYTYGYGYLNVLAAGEAFCGMEVNFGTIEGYVKDNFGNPIEGASLLALPAIQSADPDLLTDPDGFYSMDLVASTYDITASKVNYVPQTQTIEVVAGETTYAPDFILEYLGSWTELDPLPGCPDWMRYDGEYFPSDGLVYFLGGRDASITDTSIYALDPTIGECTDTGVDMYLGVSNYTIVPMNIDGADVLCTFGGRDPDGNNTDVVQCYDPVAESALQFSSLPSNFDGFTPGGVAGVENKAYVFGGLNTSKKPYVMAETWEWDPTTDTWTQLGDMSQGVGYIQTAVVDGLIYAFGGSTFDGASLIALSVASVFDPAIGTWSSISDMPTPGAEGRAYGFDSDSDYELAGQIVIAGGGIWPGETNEAFLYDVASDSYDYTLVNLNVSRRDHAGVFVPGDPGVMWVFGGVSSLAGYGGDYPPYGPPEYLEVAVGQAEIAGVTLTPETISLSGDPGVVVEYILTLENTGSMTDTYTLATDAIWETTLPLASIELPAGGTANVIVEVIVPADALPDDSDLAVVTATSTVDAEVFATSELTTVANTIHAFELTPATDAKTGEPGDIVTYRLTLTNLGNVIEAITLTYAGNDWDVHLPVTGLNLAVGVSIEVVVQVTIPEGASGSDVVTITATADSGGEVSSTLTTRVGGPYFLTLPIVFK